jgi:quercetin dioxygenase-like cupin family protein
LTGLAIDYAADPNILPEAYRQRDLAPRQRKPLAEFVFGGQWGTAIPVLAHGTTHRVPHTATIMKSGEGQTLAVVGDLYTFLATGEDTDGQYAMWDAAVLPNGGPPPHFHTREVEAFFVLEGQVNFQVSGEPHVAGPGTLLNVPTGIVHAFKNETQQRARMLIWVAPAGLEKMFEEIGQPMASQDAVPPPVTQADIDRILAVAPKYGIHIKLPT